MPFGDRAFVTDVIFSAGESPPPTAFPPEPREDSFDPGVLPGVQALFWGTAATGLARPRQFGRYTGPAQQGQEGNGVSLPPLYLGVLPLPTGREPIDPEAEGYRYLCGYAGHAIRTAERRVGPLRDHEDIIQQICVEWLEQAGPPEKAFPRLLDKAPAEMHLLRGTVNRVIARVVYQQRKRLLIADFTDWAAPSRSAEMDWVEFKSDCEKGVGRLTRQEWQVLELRRQGMSFGDIGCEMGLPKQRVWEVYHAVEARLRKIYGENGA